MALLLSTLLLIPAPAVSAAELPDAGQVEGLSGNDLPDNRELQDGDQEDIADGISMDAPAESRGNVSDNGQNSTDGTNNDDSTTGDTGNNGSDDSTVSGDGTEDDQPGDDQGFVVSENGLLTAYNGAGGEITIPAQVGDVTVKEIKNGIFRNNATLTKVTISAEITAVSDYLFEDCTNLEEVVLPGSLTEIRRTAFNGCEKLSTVVLPEKLEKIDQYAFGRCASLKSIQIPSSVKNICFDAFYKCTSLEDLTFQNGETTEKLYIDGYAFEECTSLTEVELPARVDIKGSAFFRCTSLTGFKTAEGSDLTVFDGCVYAGSELVICPGGKTEVRFLEGIKTIRGSAFAGCTVLTSVQIPDTVESIGDNAFDGCAALTKAILPKDLERIPACLFRGAAGLTEIKIPETVTEIGSKSFEGCKALKTVTVPGKIESLTFEAFLDCTGLESVYIEEGIQYIFISAFQGCKSLTTLVIPESVVDIFAGNMGVIVFENKDILTIYGKAGSFAQTYAEREDIKFSTEQPPSTDITDEDVYDISNAAFTVTLEQEVYDHDGKAKRPVVTVKKGGIELLRGTDFTVTYENNTQPGTAKAIVKGSGEYTGEVIKEFTINGIDISSSDFTVTLSQNEFTYDGTEKKPAVTVAKGTETLAGTDYTVTYENNIEPGTAKAIITGTGIYTGTVTKEFTILPAPKDISDPLYTVTLSENSYIYDGNEKRPTATVTKGTEDLLRATDFTVDYENNIQPGTAKAIVKGSGEYTGEVIKEFTINGIDISGSDFTVTLSEDGYTYDGNEKQPAVTVTKGTETLADTDYTVTYEDNIEPGTAKAIVTGTGIYTGTVTKEFTIAPAPKDISDPYFAVTLSEDSYTYDGKEKQPTVTIKAGETELSPDTDFTVTYEDNIRPGTAKAIVKGSGKYTGEVTKTFTIKGKDISGPGFTVTLSKTVYTYDGKEKRPTVTIKEGTKKLSGTSFTVKYEDNTKPGTAKAIVTGAGVYTGTVTKRFTIQKRTLGLTCRKEFTKKYEDRAFSLRANAKKGAKITYKSSDKRVADVDKKGKVTITGTGIATITIKATASGYDAQTLKVTVKISPSRSSALNLKTLRGRKLKVSWKKDKRATGYQIQYCTSKAFKKGVETININKNKTTINTIRRLTKGKRYHVRVRAYKSAKLNKKTQKLYGAWSTVERSGKILR